MINPFGAGCRVGIFHAGHRHHGKAPAKILRRLAGQGRCFYLRTGIPLYYHCTHLLIRKGEVFVQQGRIFRGSAIGFKANGADCPSRTFSVSRVCEIV